LDMDRCGFDWDPMYVYVVGRVGSPTPYRGRTKARPKVETKPSQSQAGTREKGCWGYRSANRECRSISAICESPTTHSQPLPRPGIENDDAGHTLITQCEPSGSRIMFPTK